MNLKIVIIVLVIMVVIYIMDVVLFYFVVIIGKYCLFYYLCFWNLIFFVLIMMSNCVYGVLNVILRNIEKVLLVFKYMVVYMLLMIMDFKKCKINFW